MLNVDVACQSVKVTLCTAYSQVQPSLLIVFKCKAVMGSLDYSSY